MDGGDRLCREPGLPGDHRAVGGDHRVVGARLRRAIAQRSCAPTGGRRQEHPLPRPLSRERERGANEAACTTGVSVLPERRGGAVRGAVAGIGCVGARLRRAIAQRSCAATGGRQGHPLPRPLSRLRERGASIRGAVATAGICCSKSSLDGAQRNPGWLGNERSPYFAALHTGYHN
jgi:hypothetical protein